MWLFKRYGLVLCTAAYTSGLILLHLLGRFPAPGAYDLARLAGAPNVLLEGKVINFPQTRWGQTRFLLEGHAEPLTQFRGRALVTLRFPIEDLAPGEQVRARGWLSRPRPASRRRAFDEQHFWSGFGVFSRQTVWSPAAFERLEADTPTRFSQRPWQFHQCFKQFWFDSLPLDEAALISCMTLGSRGILPSDIKNQCIRAGVYHILVVSGQNMALIIALAVAVLSALRIPRRWALWICIGPIIFYTAAVGSDPPVNRAAVMALGVLAIVAIGRDTPRYIPFVLAWITVLVLQPEALFGASFQLSFSATASLMAVGPWRRRLSRIPHRWLRWFAEAALVSLAVHAGVWPFLLIYFHQISLSGFIANWTLFPLSGVVMVLGLIIGLVGVCAPSFVPDSVLDGMHYLLKGSLVAIARMSHWRWAAIPISAPSLTVCVVYYAALICILIKLRHAQKPTKSRGGS